MLATTGASERRSGQSAGSVSTRTLGLLNYDSDAHIGSKYTRLHNPAMNIHVAIINFRLAAEQRMCMPSALCKLGFLQELGCTAFPANYSEAIKLYLAAAAHGHPEALFRLAVCHERGRGVPQNRDSAIEFYQKAQEAGYTDHDHVHLQLRRLGAAPPPSSTSTPNAIFNFLSRCFPTSTFKWLRARCPVVGPKVEARFWFLLLTSIFAPFIAYSIHSDYHFTIALPTAFRLLIMSPWFVTAYSFTRHRSIVLPMMRLIILPMMRLIRRIIEELIRETALLNSLLDSLVDLCSKSHFSYIISKDRFQALLCCLVARALSSIFSSMWLSRQQWRVWNPYSFSLAWTGPPYDFFVFAVVFFNQCASCFGLSFLHLLLLDSL